LRFIIEIKGINLETFENDAIELKKKIKQVKKQEYYKGQKKDIKKLYDELDKLQIIEDYVILDFETVEDFYRANKGFYINGKKYKRLLGMPSGLKNKNVIYVAEWIYPELSKRIKNGHNPDIEIVPSKYEAYKALSCSSSVPIPFTRNIIVVKDCYTHFKDTVLVLDDTETRMPKLNLVEDYEVELDANDGFGLVTPEFNIRINEAIGESGLNSGHCLRGAFVKGMIVPFDFKRFADEVAHEYMVEDIWGDKRDIREADMILTESMLKLWSAYNNLEHYLDNCEANHFGFAITKACPQELENIRELNYQFIQSYQLDDNDIQELTQPTIDKFKDILELNFAKAVLFLKGMGLNEQNINYVDADFAKALMIEPELLKDKFVYTKIFNMLKKKINQAKIGHLEVNGNFQIVVGDPYSLCQSMFGLEVTGLLAAGEVYSKYWVDRGVEEVVGFRAPMTPHNNIRRMKITNKDECQYWYKYLTTVIILNSWDTITAALNGCDFDADTIFTTNNKVLLNKLEDTPAIICIQKNAKKEKPTEQILQKSNKQSFGQKIGVVTNRATTMFNLISKFDKDSPEFKELDYRIKACQNYQQNAIDATKGIIAQDMPKEWYDLTYLRKMRDRVIEEDHEEMLPQIDFDISIVADKKPYFMGYVYPRLLKEFKTYKKNCNAKCIQLFGLEIGELYERVGANSATPDQLEFLDKFERMKPLDEYPCLMNRICYKFEDIFDSFLVKRNHNADSFDYKLLKTTKSYDSNVKKQIENAIAGYTKEMSDFKYLSSFNKMQKEEISDGRLGIKTKLIKRCEEICPNQEDLCNILVDLCYQKNFNKQFIWDISGEQIIINLLVKHNFEYNVPVKAKYGNYSFLGERYDIIQIQAKAGEWYE